MVPISAQPPNIPTSAIVGQVLGSDRNILPGRRRAAGQGEHVDLLVGQQGADFATARAGNIGLNVLIAGDRQMAAKIRHGTNGGEMMVPAKGSVRMIRKDAAEERFLCL